MILYFFFSIRRRHTRLVSDWSSDVCSSDLYIVPTCQRLFTLETCCGYGYGPARDLHPLPRIFKGQRELTGRRRNRDAFQGTGPSLGANPFQGALPFTKKREIGRASCRERL